MAPLSNPSAREPSMEEILASIRRIIEDSDSARRSTDDLADEASEEAPPVKADDRDGFQYDAEGAAPEVEAFRTELAEPVMAEARPPVVEPEALSEPVGGPQIVSNNRERDDSEEVPVQAKLMTYEARSSQPAIQPADEEGSTRGDGADRGAIISDFAGRQVAAAFEELSEAFSASRKRSYDEIAEEIMRPMLQEWLDNNLPLLVERLVREEIERVARGGAR